MRGNENVIDGKVVCDYCADYFMWRDKHRTLLFQAREAFELVGLDRREDWPHDPELIERIDAALYPTERDK